MKKNISPITVETISVVAIPPTSAKADASWNVYLINEGEEDLENVIVAGRGYGNLEGREKTTTVLRYFFQRINAGDRVLIEPIQPALFEISNEYSVSFNQGEHMLDRRFTFPADTISREGLNDLGVYAQ